MPAADTDAKHPSDEFWRSYLTKGAGPEHAFRVVLRFLPDNPRCKSCAVVLA